MTRGLLAAIPCGGNHGGDRAPCSAAPANVAMSWPSGADVGASCVPAIANEARRIKSPYLPCKVHRRNETPRHGPHHTKRAALSCTTLSMHTEC